mgnify:CR=1 FL=1|tara:strand:- start:98 stop:913 length:816 start_codon:yes stop_codon:yes gene_type:complete
MILKLLNTILFRLKHKILLKKYQKKFKTYKELEKFCNQINQNNYSNIDLNNYRLKRFLSSFDKIPNQFQSSFKLLLEAVSFYIYDFKEFPKILDIGGVYGEGFLYLRGIYKNATINYSIVENNKVVELSKIIDFKNKYNQKINFYETLEQALNENEYDIIFSSGTLQYLENPYELLEKLNNSNSKLIALTRNAFHLNEEMISQMSYLYSNGSGEIITQKYKNKVLVYPHKTLIEKKLINILNNYSIEFSKDLKKIHQFNNTYSKDILFKKI